MTYEEMALEFDNKWDKPYSAYFGPTRLSQIFNEAQVNVIEDRYRQFQANRKIPDELSGLVVSDTTAGLNAVTLAKPSDYYHYLTCEVTYDIEGEEITKVPYAPTEDMRFVDDPFEEATIAYPLIRIFDQIYFYPEDTNVQDVTLIYIKSGNEINVLDNQTEPIYNLNMQYAVIREAVNIASQISRDQLGYQLSENEIKQNP